jgi:hypothetical protein
MFIDIDDNRTLREVQLEFHNHFPYLKLEFFGHSHGIMEPSCPADAIDCTCRISDVRKRHIPGRIEITPNQKTGVVEQHFKKRFDLNVQVYRLYGKVWVQTSGSDEMTLQEQNDLGRQDSEAILKPAVLKQMLQI